MPPTPIAGASTASGSFGAPGAGQADDEGLGGQPLQRFRRGRLVRRGSGAGGRKPVRRLGGRRDRPWRPASVGGRDVTRHERSGMRTRTGAASRPTAANRAGSREAASAAGRRVGTRRTYLRAGNRADLMSE